MNDFIDVTRHATRRCRERGLRRRDVARLIDVADRRVFVGNGCTSLSLTRDGIADLVGDGWPPADLMRLTRHCVLPGDAGAVVTVLAGNRRRMRPYRCTGARR